MSEQIIFHHYPQSPASEKVRVVFGIKDLSWRSVEIPRLPPRPELMPLTGGYRRTPVMQIGADVYCDTQCITRELDRRFPEPSLFPNGTHGLIWGLGRWIDGPIFALTAAVMFGEQGQDMPEAFARDRGRLYFGPDYSIDQLCSQLAQNRAQLRGQIGWMAQRLGDGRAFMSGGVPGLVDALCYHIIWFIRGRHQQGPDFLAQFPGLCAWEERVAAIGHGKSAPMGADDALVEAAAADPVGGEKVDPADPRGLEEGDQVKVVPDGIGGDPAVEGVLAGLTSETVTILRVDDPVGQVAVHFPRVGYRVWKD